ncbi:MAG: hypothetical protein LM590_00520 [Thermofilum sp.]|jgi:hypothetical protein|nr:hypothetical protein [Thermofilum sp.]
MEGKDEELQEKASPFAKLEYEEWVRHQTPHIEVNRKASQRTLLLAVLTLVLVLVAIYVLLFL